jgi:flagellar basal-body rod modification protein FlgD
MSTAISGTTATTTTTDAAAAMKKDLGMNKDDFLKLYIAQLQNQDPLNPQDSTEMLSQLAQMTQVEQGYNTTTALNNLLAAQNSSTAMSAVSLIGGTVTATGDQVSFDGTNSAVMKYTMPGATASTTLTITDSSGKTVRSVDLGAQAAGAGTYQWDGCDGQGNLLAAGAYSFSISGKDSAGGTQTATTYTTGIVSGVDLSTGSAVLKIGSASVPLANVINVSVS